MRLLTLSRFLARLSALAPKLITRTRVTLPTSIMLDNVLGLLARTKFPVGPTRGSDVTDEIASYIDTIRTRKEELINGKD